MSNLQHKSFNYDEGMKELTNINEVIQKIQKGITQVTSAFEQFGAYNLILSNELPKLYDKSSVFKSVITQFSDIFARLNVILNHSSDKIKSCKIYFTDWQQHFDKAKKIKSNHDQAKKKYDHYEQKVEKLRKKQKELIQKNKETLKDKQKLERNEVKLQNSQQQYKISSDESLRQIQDVYISRYDNLHSFVAGYMASIKEMSAKLDDKLSEIHNPKNSFDKCRQEVLKQKQDERIKKAIDQDMVLIQKAEEREKAKYQPPPIPDVSVRRKSLHLEMNQDEQRQAEQNQNFYNQTPNVQNNDQEEPIYGMEYVSNNNYNNNTTTTNEYTPSYNNQASYNYGHQDSNQESHNTNLQNYSSNLVHQSSYGSPIQQNQNSNYYSNMQSKRFSESNTYSQQQYNYGDPQLQFKAKSATQYSQSQNYQNYGDSYNKSYGQDYRFRNESQTNTTGLQNLNIQHSVSVGAQSPYNHFQANQQNHHYQGGHQYQNQKSSDPFDLLDD
ncbi:hypothetical protein TTHERM_00260720 (macronuclear) [Tetrahymena thermophila SB210]|uniref:Uncharacterized protein n=1 Tax=Tetrahymena thermophila (strain SB210) TaxID=312017 RepID=Q22UB3_TETTS|nr:hypothetical protein TTHERM_00260720 [Tetrahymena thermophila SB210]EAR88774.2 hypothetical protein TTHERM_00260720 [Tetrahymena thermophila SB210]|eukprot:XP_001009019.2 hypothetical protein TTHERM_00260720 [Tetrahymena thermophila SB210]